jgi:hypothetical protein
MKILLNRTALHILRATKLVLEERTDKRRSGISVRYVVGGVHRWLTSDWFLWGPPQINGDRATVPSSQHQHHIDSLENDLLLFTLFPCARPRPQWLPFRLRLPYIFNAQSIQQQVVHHEGSQRTNMSYARDAKRFIFRVG